MKKIKIDIARKPITFVQCDERHSIFAPSFDLLMSHKNGFINWDEYTDAYKKEMREAFLFDPDSFYEMADRLENVELICWCNAKKKQDNKCHRFLLQEILLKVKNSE